MHSVGKLLRDIIRVENIKNVTKFLCFKVELMSPVSLVFDKTSISHCRISKVDYHSKLTLSSA